MNKLKIIYNKNTMNFELLYFFLLSLLLFVSKNLQKLLLYKLHWNAINCFYFIKKVLSLVIFVNILKAFSFLVSWKIKFVIRVSSIFQKGTKKVALSKIIRTFFKSHFKCFLKWWVKYAEGGDENDLRVM